MALPTADDFLERFPEFSEADEDKITLAIEDAGDEVDANIWMTKDYAKGVLFLAAHFLVSGTTQAELIEEGGGTGSSGGSGDIASESLGRFSVSYDTSSESSSSSSSSDELDLTETVYGQRYLHLLRRNNLRLLIV